VHSIRKHLSYANVMATFGVFLALGGTAAAFTVGKNSVKSKSIAKGAVKTSDIHNGAVSKAKLKTGAIPASAIADGSIGAKQLDNVVVRLGTAALADPGVQDAQVLCKPDEQAIAGGSNTTGINFGSTTVLSSNPIQANRSRSQEGTPLAGWDTVISNSGGGSGTAIAYAVCLQ
jgi:hypothetical protein